MYCAANVFCEELLNIVNLLIRDGKRLTSHGNESCDASGKEHNAFDLGRNRRMAKYVPRKKRKLHQLAPVAPSPYLRDQWQKIAHALLPQLSSNDPFVSRTCLDRLPTDVRPDSGICGCSVKWPGCAHSFALWVPLNRPLFNCDVNPPVVEKILAWKP
jgi:hypothetical protein